MLLLDNEDAILFSCHFLLISATVTGNRDLQDIYWTFNNKNNKASYKCSPPIFELVTRIRNTVCLYGQEAWLLLMSFCCFMTTEGWTGLVIC